MLKRITNCLPTLGICVYLMSVVVITASGEVPDEWSGEVRSILADACFRCHGADVSQRQAELRLDRGQDWLADRGGYRVVVPGDFSNSELYRRITSENPEDRMPPADAVRQLSEHEIGSIRRWIERGADWRPHWSFVPARHSALPMVQDGKWSNHALDQFVLARLEKAGLEPSPLSRQVRLLRRVTLDLRGLPPTVEEIDKFLADSAPHAYERVVDRLLASIRYGEHMAATWLDLARFADTDGYHDDEPRTMWRWREWLVNVLNDNLPFDQFTLQQLAGDLLPNATSEQHLATGFLRNNRVNGEGGVIADEFRVEYIVDRVETVSSVWMGLSTGCARCHDHKYDPISQREFYSLFAFFNQTPEPGQYRRTAPPTIQVPTRTTQRRLDALDFELAALDQDSARYKKLTESKQKLLDAIPETMVMDDTEPRETFVLVRGQYNQPSEKVTADVPASLPPMPVDADRNRLGLARWLIDPSHPLTGRVTANRLWQFHFGRGIVRTAEEFGAQGEAPSHPQLLDWLATELVRREWNVKAIQRIMVTSATYRQSSKNSPAMRETDPDNRLLSHGPRGRLSAEVIRDQALFAGGLLVERIGGPSVKPYQPAKMWLEVAGVTTSAYRQGYVQATGEDLYRRSIYTFWRRAIPPPSMAIFDAPSREVCVARRDRTNTPLQALALMNDVTYIEAARALGERMIQQGGATAADRLTFGFRLVTSRRPRLMELDVLLRGLERHRKTFRQEAEMAEQLVNVGNSKPDSKLDVSELAAYTALANTMLNLDETVNKP